MFRSAKGLDVFSQRRIVKQLEGKVDVVELKNAGILAELEVGGRTTNIWIDHKLPFVLHLI